MKQYWQKHYKEQGLKAVGHVDFTREQFLLKTRELQIIYEPLFRWCFGGMRVLDLGCGWGRFAKVLVDVGVRVHGIDIAEWAIGEAKKRVPQGIFETYNGQHIPYEDSFFNGVLSWTVLQHIPPDEIGDITKEISRVLASGGYLLLYENISTWLDDKPHIWFRSPETYEELFEGLRCIREEIVEDADGTGEQHILMVFQK